MPPLVIDVAKAEDARDVVHRVVQALAEGRLVALPTETVYGVGAAATRPDAVERLAEAKGRDANSPFALAVKSAEDAEDYAPGWNAIAGRLARRCWPGPVTLVVDGDHPDGLVGQLPDEVRPFVCPNGTIGLRAPANAFLQDVLRMLAGPIVLTSANRSGEPDATTAAQCVDALGEHLAIVVDDGPARYGQASSVVRVTKDGFDVLREGVVGKPTLERLSRMLVVFVCTGNTCRSPMAEALMKLELARRLGAEPDELEQHGVIVTSAGVAASPGSPASPQAAELMRDRGLAIDTHSSQQLGDHLVTQADLIIALTQGHARSALQLWPEAASRVKLLMADGHDVADPIGGSADVYRRCAEQIESGVRGHAEAVVAALRSA